MNTKICTKCGVDKVWSEFHRTKSTKIGIISQCKPCKNKIIGEWDKRNLDKKRKSSLESYYRHHEKKKELARQYKKNNSEKIKSYAKKWRIDNKEMIKKYYKDNKDWFKTWNSNRRAKLIQACVPWANLEKIKQIYAESLRLTKETGIQHHVDHKYPLNGKTICGLHHEDNLQILRWDDNLSKSNKFVPE